MALLETVIEGVTETWVGTGLLAVGAIMAAPALVRDVRPLTKQAIKGGLIVYDKTRGFAAEAGEQWSDLVAEARHELTTLPATATKAAKEARPLGRRVIKGGMVIYDKARRWVAEAGEQWSDLVAEARHELEASSTAASAKKRAIGSSSSSTAGKAKARSSRPGAAKSRGMKARASRSKTAKTSGQPASA